MKNIRDFLSENFQFLEVKISTYLNRHVFVMIDIFFVFLHENICCGHKICFHGEIKIIIYLFLQHFRRLTFSWDSRSVKTYIAMTIKGTHIMHINAHKCTT